MQDINIISNSVEQRLLTDNSRLCYEFVKRIIDIIFAVIIGIISFPIILITCICVCVESPGKPIYKQERVGKNGRKFTIYKIRSMSIDAEKNGAQWATINDDRITNVGKFIRKTRIDELPQLVNLLKGDMTLVGPRPERQVFIEKFEKMTPGFKKRLLVKPGLTGLAQISGGYDLNHEEKLVYDLEYINNRTILLDIKIIFKTIKVVLTGEGAR